MSQPENGFFPRGYILSCLCNSRQGPHASSIRRLGEGEDGLFPNLPNRILLCNGFQAANRLFGCGLLANPENRLFANRLVRMRLSYVDQGRDALVLRCLGEGMKSTLLNLLSGILLYNGFQELEKVVRGGLVAEPKNRLFSCCCILGCSGNSLQGLGASSVRCLGQGKNCLFPNVPNSVLMCNLFQALNKVSGSGLLANPENCLFTDFA